MLTEDLLSFACMEQPICCFLSSSAHNKRLGSKPQGDIFITENRKEWERWYIIPASNDGQVLLQNVTHGHYLKSDDEGRLSTTHDTNDQQTKWSTKKHSDDKFTIKSVVDDKAICCTEEYAYAASDKEGDEWIRWNIEFETGELCFISSYKRDLRISKHSSLKVGLEKTWKGWGIWRFIEFGDGNVLISSWLDPSQYLCSNAMDGTGRVYTTTNRFANGAKWSVESNFDKRGIVIKSCYYGGYLRIGGNYKLSTDCTILDDSLWCLEHASRHVYYISDTANDIGISVDCDDQVMTKNEGAWKEWKLHGTNVKGSCMIECVGNGKFLQSSENGVVYVLESPNEDGGDVLWKIEASSLGGYFLISDAHNKYLSYNGEGLHTVSAEQEGAKIAKIWTLKPCLPNKPRNSHRPFCDWRSWSE